MDQMEQIKKLREETCVSLNQCKKALEESGGDLERAKEILKKWGEDVAQKKSTRATSAGIIESYIHSNKKIGVLIELRCETDFVARNRDFQNLAHAIAMHIAAFNPLYISEEEISPEFLENERRICREQFANEKKPPQILEKMIEGKMAKFKQGICLLTQPFVKDDSRAVKAIINEAISKIGENISVKKFIRFEI